MASAKATQANTIVITYDESISNCARIAANQFEYDTDATNGDDSSETSASNVTCTDGGTQVTVVFGSDVVTSQASASDRIRYNQSPSTPSDRVVDTAGNHAVSPDQVGVDDGIAPSMASAEAIDTDTVVIAYDEPMLDCASQSPSQFEYAPGDGTPTKATSLSCDPSTGFDHLMVTFPSAIIHDTDSDDTIRYTASATMRDTSPAQNAATTPDEAAVDDGVAPAMASAVATDTDTVVITYDEPIGNCDSVAASQFEYDTDGTNDNDSVETPASSVSCTDGQTTVTVGFTSAVVTDQSSASDVIRYKASEGTAGRLQDSAGNEAVDPDQVAVDDGIAPVMTSATTDDGDGDGQIDQITVNFSEQVDITDGDATDALPGFSVAGYTIANGDYAAADTTSLVLTLDELDQEDTDATPTVTYDRNTSNGPTVADNADNEHVDGDTVTPADGAAPAFLAVMNPGIASATTSIDLTFSEAVYHGGTFSSGDFVVTNNQGGDPPATVTVTGSAPTTEGAASLTLALTVEAFTPTGTVQVELTVQGAAKVKDVPGNASSAATHNVTAS